MTSPADPVQLPHGPAWPNRFALAPLTNTQSHDDGTLSDDEHDWLVARGRGGFGLVLTCAAYVDPAGQAWRGQLGVASDAHLPGLTRLADSLRATGTRSAVQLHHGGLRADSALTGQALRAPWDHPKSGAVALTTGEVEAAIESFVAAAVRSEQAGFDGVQVHGAHGYLIGQFLDPRHERSDRYGGSLENRARLPLRVAKAVREVWPESLPMFVRISSTDWIEGGWDLEQSIQLSRWMKDIGVDLMDCSSGAVNAASYVPAAPGFHVPFATAIRKEAGIATGAVGLITEAVQAEQILGTGLADLIFIGRGFLEDPYWALHAARTLRAEGEWPVQYARAVGIQRKV